VIEAFESDLPFQYHVRVSRSTNRENLVLCRVLNFDKFEVVHGKSAMRRNGDQKRNRSYGESVSIDLNGFRSSASDEVDSRSRPESKN
jgi:hypothetical protein